MPRRLVYAPRARDALDAIRGWLTQPGAGPAACRRLAAIRAAINRLRQGPCVFPVVDQARVRELPCEGGYHALYRVRPNTGRNDTAGDVIV